MGHIELAFSLRRSNEDLLFEKLHQIGAAFPHIAATIGQLWGSADLDAYFDRIIIKDRERRAGFPEAIATALLTLSNEHIRVFNFRTPKTDDFWDPFLRHVFR